MDQLTLWSEDQRLLGGESSQKELADDLQVQLFSLFRRANAQIVA